MGLEPNPRASRGLDPSEKVKIYRRLLPNRRRHRVTKVERTKLEVASIIEQFLDGTGGKWDWDDFCSHGISDPYLDSVRVECMELNETHPPTKKGHYCSDVGFEVMRGLVATLRASK
jgi:hypothetical protein